MEIVVIKDSDITIIVTECNVTVKSGIADSSTLLMSWVVRNGRSCASNLVGGVWVSIVVLFSGPDLSRSKNTFISDADLVELVIISTGQESSALLNNLETPRFSIAMGSIDKSLISSIHVDCNDSTIIMTKYNLVIKNINGRCEMLNGAIDLSDEFELSSLCRVDCDFVIFTSRDQVTLSAYDSCAVALMSFEDETEFASLVPAMNGTVSTTGVSKTIFIKSTTVELSLWVFLTKSTVLEKFLRGISWVPELKRSGCNSYESKIILFL